MCAYGEVTELGAFLQNARYVVQEGARAQIQDWDPEENGGFAVHGEQFRLYL